MASTSTNNRKSVSLLPTYFQTGKNEKFLSSTLDQLYRTPELTRIKGFVGNKLGVTFNPLTDVYISDSTTDTNSLRNKYQFEPALTTQDVNGNIKNAFGIDDLVNQLRFYGQDTNNFNYLFAPDINSYDPHIDWDKFVNFNQYYWLPIGPDPISISGIQRETISTYSVRDSADKNYFIFTPDGVTEDPLLTFYKGVTYVFNVNTSHNFYLKTVNTQGADGQLTESDGVLNNGIKNGQIIFTVGDTLPGVIYYTSDNGAVVTGEILVKSIAENSYLDVEADIIGKSQYTTASGIEFINGLKVKFIGNVTPVAYADKEFYVEGVGDSIKLIDTNLLTTPEQIATLFDDNFDATAFDDYPFDSFKTLPLTPEFVTINRASQDLNPWTRYNRWFHADVIKTSAIANGVAPILPLKGRANRPIIEFKPNIQLYNFGAFAIPPVDIIDQTTTDAFSLVEKSTSYVSDGVQLEAGQRIVFNADPDPLVRGKVFEVTLALISGQYVINLVEVHTSAVGDGMIVISGTVGQGTEWWFDGTEWVVAQQRTVLNQAPLYDLFDGNGNSYSDKIYYNAIFSGNKVFGYSIGTGTPDPVLGFPLNYQSVGVEGSYLFENYFTISTLSLIGQNTVTEVPTSTTFLRINNTVLGSSYKNVWTTKTNYDTDISSYQLAVQQFQIVSPGIDSIPITVYDKPALINDLKISVYANNVKMTQGTALSNTSTDYIITTSTTNLSIQFVNTFTTTTTVVLRCYSNATPNVTGIYETPINLTNNPLNGNISKFTLSELSDHVITMEDRDPNYREYNGSDNLKSLPFAGQYGSRLITNNNPLSFAQLFLTDIKHSLISAMRSSANDYYQFKLNLTKFISQSNGDLTSTWTPADVLDQALASLLTNKNSSFPYGRSDMLGYGTNYTSGNYTVTDSRNTNYPLSSIFDITALSIRSVLVYLNGNILTYGRDYTFDTINPNVIISAPLAKGDVVHIRDYTNTVGSYIPPTPTKLGLYPKFIPMMYVDNSYASTSAVVLQGHDGSLTVAYTSVTDFNNNNIDFRDLTLLEYENRVFNNLKVTYNEELVDINDVMPGVFRSGDYTYNEIFGLVEEDFVKWTSTFGLDFLTNTSYDVNNHKTWNYAQSSDSIFNQSLPGNWRGIYKFYFDTDRPNICPWEMLGFSVEPDWWQNQYGPAPYTAGNLNLWQDLEAGLIRQGPRAGIDETYIRTGLSQIIPVDDSGNTLDVRTWGGIVQTAFSGTADLDWKFGDCGPVETAWRRSSLWPYAVQVILALARPADYASKLFDPARLVKDLTNTYRYGSSKEFLNPTTVYLHNDVDSTGNVILASGYSVLVIENGLKRASSYLADLKQDLSTVNFNLFYKTGGFLSKDKLEIVIDSVSPNTVSPGVLLPNEDYTLLFNVSNPVDHVSISGMIIEKNNGQFIVKGYDRQSPFFTIFNPVHKSNDSSITVGGKSVSFLIWAPNTFYQSGQIVQYNNNFYRVVSSSTSSSTFDTQNYIKISALPVEGGATVLSTNTYEKTETIVPYGSKYNTLQEVYDLIVGYGAWLTNKGFIFNRYNTDLETVLDWNFSGKEFLFWTTQNWADGSIITVSPFANQLQYKFTNAVVDNVLDSFYDYSLLKADGKPFPYQNFDIDRAEGICTVTSKNTAEGFYFARLNLVQKEHAIVMNNSSMFGDVIYDIETGYRQSRINLSGFITAGWNGDFLSPGFIYDEAVINNWQAYTDYRPADIVKYSGKYYSAKKSIDGTSQFNFADWNVLGSAPVAQLLPNFDYKINQFEDFYSLDIDNFDAGQQKMAQHLTGYTPRLYLTNIFVDPIAQYKFYQGFIKEKGTANAIQKLAKASVHNLQGQIEFNEEWAIRIGSYGGYSSFNQLEFPLREVDFVENSQIVKFVDNAPVEPNDLLSYIVPGDISLVDPTFSSNSVFDVAITTYDDNNLALPTAGYVRTDDIIATAYNKSSLLDISNNGALNEGDTIWMGFKDLYDWDVYRYTIQSAKIKGTSLSGTSLTFTTDKFHGVSPGDIVSIKGLDNGTDGIYEIVSAPTLTTFIVNTTLTTIAASTVYGLLFKFVSVRAGEFDNISDLSNLITFKDGDKIWTDRGDGTLSTSSWAVFEKTTNFNTPFQLPGLKLTDQNYGYRIFSSNNTTTVVISSPIFNSGFGGYGRIFLKDYDQATDSYYNVANYGLATLTYGNDSQARFGNSVYYDPSFDVTITGAPGVNVLQVSKLDRPNKSRQVLLEHQESLNFSNLYGKNLFVVETSTSTRTLFVTSPGANSVYIQTLALTTNSAVLTTSSVISIASVSADYPIAGTIDASVIAVGCPDSAKVYVYTGTNYSMPSQTINIPPVCKSTDNFGYDIEMSEDGSYLIVSSTTVYDPENGPGKVFVYENVSGEYQLSQTINNPAKSQFLSFGETVHLDSVSKTLVASSLGKQTTTLVVDGGATIFDAGTTQFTDSTDNSGSVYIFERYNKKFVYAHELIDNSTTNSGSYGKGISINSTSIFIGAPTDSRIGTVFVYNKIDPSVQCWKVFRESSNLVDVSKIKKTVTIDTFKDQIVDYLDIIDPVKGRIAGLADQELTYKSAFDPAIYSVGVQGVVVDTNSSWIEDHVGELWWDLSTVKYVWYEQSDLEYRKNSWGKLFPGASIDVYEWVQSEYLPSQWSALADTADGLSKGISGQPKYPNNNIISVKQYYNASTGQISNVYFYWVKNTVILPSVANRRISANSVASIIFDPAAYGSKFVSIISSDAIAVTNVKGTLYSNNVYLNISKDQLNSTVNKHTEWLLIGEGNASDMPTEMLDKKLMDSLVGSDSLGNLVPDPLLNDRVKYGIEIRPRQSMFVDRNAALRNSIEYVNSVMSLYRISDIINFNTLNSKEEIPSIYSNSYDQIVDTYEDLSTIVISTLSQGELTCTISTGTSTYGTISTISIVSPGAGYSILLPQVDPAGYFIPNHYQGPSVVVKGDTSDALITTTVDSSGSIISTNIVNPGSGFNSAPTLEVRPYTVIVKADSNSNNLWAQYELRNNQWIKVHTQNYNTTQYWNYVDWTSTDYDPLKPLIATIEEPYLLDTLSLNVGDYVKVNNQGNGRYMVLKYVETSGTYDTSYDLVLSENGTIKFSDNLWNIKNNIYNFDYYFTYDQTEYDQTPGIELTNILSAIKNDIFIGSLKVYWNLFFFKAVKYALSEQKFLDWAFKTSFVNVKNMAGSLDQRHVYKFQDSQYYEDYIKEVKPYHTKIRNYQVNYDALDNSQSYITDFDRPAYYDNSTQQFLTVEEGDSLLNTYPWKGWNDNYGLIVDSITVESSGSGYTSVPNVLIIAAPGDTGSGATAEAFISLGKVISIVVTNPGSGYKQTPTVVLTGGGSSKLVPCRAYPVMANSKVRTNYIELKFDRVSSTREISSTYVVDNFYCNGNTNEFLLSWAAENKKANIDLTVDGIKVLATDYTIVNYYKRSNNYNKLFSNLVLDFTPSAGSTVTISYNKNIELYHAVDRIEDYYSPTAGMPGVDPAQLMVGVDFPGTELQGLPFSYTTNWDIAPFAQELFGDDSNSYTVATVAVNANTGTLTLILDNVSGIIPGLRVTTVALTTTTDNQNKFASSNVVVTSVNTSTSAVTFSTSTVESITSGTVRLEFWDFNLTPGVLDTVIEGGSWTGTTLANALGISPSDVILDGDQFISPYVGHAPEEFIKGEMHESLGISVFTSVGGGSPLIARSVEQISQTTATTTVNLGLLPPNTGSVFVSFNNLVMIYGRDYTIDYVNQTLTLNTQTTTGLLGIVCVDVGGVGYVSNDFVTVNNTSSASVSVGNLNEVGSIYASLDGRTLNSSEYIVGIVDGQGSRGKITVTGLTTGTHTLQAWGFMGNNNPYSVVHEQTAIGDGRNTAVILSDPPGKYGAVGSAPPNAQIIVEIENRMLIPPNTTYWSVAGGQTTFEIDPKNQETSGVYSLSVLEVYVSGVRARNGIDFVLHELDNTIEFKSGFLKTGDVIAITNWAFSDWWYEVDSNTLFIKSTGNWGYNQILRVITFTDSTGDLIRLETYKVHTNNRYFMSRPVLNDKYVWVTIGNNSLINGSDYYIDVDNQTVIVRDTWPYVAGDTVAILSMTDITADTAVGYRRFTDILERTQYKRISKNNSARLLEPLYSTSTQIVVDNGGALSLPNPALKSPGVIMIAAERIEYSSISGNILSGIKRGTLGTGAKFVHPAGTKVFDASYRQSLPFGENVTTVHITATNTSSYNVSGLTWKYTIDHNTVTNTYIKTLPIDQALVFYGGNLLRKEGIYKQNTSLAYDNSIDPATVYGTTSTVNMLPETSIVGLAYLVTSTNQVWVYTASNGTGTNYFNGYVYSGLDYLPPQFDIISSSGTTSTAVLTLNLPSITTGTRITLVQKTAPNTFYYSTNTSLLNDSGIVASFLRAEHSGLPDKYYYGQL